MGSPKAELPWSGGTLLGHMAATLAAGLDGGPVLVAARPGQVVAHDPLIAGRVDDRDPGHGPLAGMIAGLAALADRADVVFVAACDLPLLESAIVRTVLAAVGPDDHAAVPVVGGFPQPLAAAYAISALAALEEAYEEGIGGPRGALARLRVRYLDVADVVSFTNVNDAASLDEARRIARGG
jgi:molybdopterin-guanine dinucleotide biosynthesis protein A